MTAAPAPRFEPHNRVAGKFRLGKRLATGGMGEVWVARNDSTGAEVALKMMRRGDADHEHELRIEERFRHEAMLSAMLSHRSIVKVFDLIEEPSGLLVLVMELLRGETLQAYLERKGPRPAREGVAIVCPILSALSHAHFRGVVHRDVTPSNIFLAVDPDGHVTPKLVDFGIAKLIAGGTLPATRHQAVQTIDGRVLGTPRYMAPERIRGTEQLDGRADLFAVGVVLYETLTGASPFAASSPSASLAAVLERPVDPDPRIDPRLWIEIRRAISKRAYERHVSADELATSLRAAIGEAEGALEASLRRSTPAQAWDTDEGLFEGPARENKTIDGQSVAVVPRKRVLSPLWLLAGAGAAVLVGSALGLRAKDPSRAQQGSITSSPAAAVSAALVVAPGLAPTSSTGIAAEVESGAAPVAHPGVATGALATRPLELPAGVASAGAGGAAPTSTGTAKPVPAMVAPVPIGHPAAPLLRRKSIATTPGF